MEMKNVFAEENSKEGEAEGNKENNEEANTKIQKFDSLDDGQKLKVYRALKKQV